jgi:hypothetical protein
VHVKIINSHPSDDHTSDDDNATHFLFICSFFFLKRFISQQAVAPCWTERSVFLGLAQLLVWEEEWWTGLSKTAEEAYLLFRALAQKGPLTTDRFF